MNIKNIFGYILLILHNMIIPLSFILFLYTNNIIFLYLILCYFSMVVVSWMIFGSCLLTIFENNLLDQKTIRYNSGQNRSYTSIQIEKILGTSTTTTHKIAISIPLFMIFAVLTKRYFLLNKNDITILT